MANFLVTIEMVGDHPHPAALEALGQARRVGSSLGATVYAFAACERMPTFDDADLIGVLSQHGADKILLCTGASHAGPMRWGSQGAAILAACQRVQPSLVLIADTSGARDVASRVAARLGAAYLGDASIEVGEAGLLLWEGSGPGARKLDGDIDFTVVAAVPPGRYTIADGDEEAEVEVLNLPPSTAPQFEPVEGAAAVAAPVVLGEGDLAQALADALDAVLTPTEQDAAALSSAPLVVAVGATAGEAPLAADVRVGLGDAAASSTVDYAVAGEPKELARELAEQIASGKVKQP